MRGAGEIDITRPRWSERPRTLLPLILGHIKNFERGAAKLRFEQGRQEAWAKEQDVLSRSEEHTSELQSLRHLVCRLLLEKKKKQNYNNTSKINNDITTVSKNKQHKILKKT